MWPCGSSAILLYGGRSPEGQGPLPGHMLIDPPPLADMWRFDLDLLSWTRIPRGGGGSPPAPRAEAALAPLIGGGFDPGSAVILGGYSELLHEILPMSRDAYSFRYCDDAHFRPRRAGIGLRLPGHVHRLPHLLLQVPCQSFQTRL